MAVVPDLGERVVRERIVRRQVDRFLRLPGGFVQLLALQQGERQQRMPVRMSGILAECLAQLRLREIVPGLLIQQPAALDGHFSFRYVRMSS